MSRYNSDALDEACEEMLGHTNWAYGKNPNEKEIECVVIFYKEPDEDENENEEDE
jgi:hypothetical protein